METAHNKEQVTSLMVIHIFYRTHEWCIKSLMLTFSSLSNSVCSVFPASNITNMVLTKLSSGDACEGRG